MEAELFTLLYILFFNFQKPTTTKVKNTKTTKEHDKHSSTTVQPIHLNEVTKSTEHNDIKEKSLGN